MRPDGGLFLQGGGGCVRVFAGLRYRAYRHTQALSIHIKRLLKEESRSVVFDANGSSYGFAEHSGGELVDTTQDSRPIRIKPDKLGCYVINVNRTDRGQVKERLCDNSVEKGMNRVPSAKIDVGYWCGY